MGRYAKQVIKIGGILFGTLFLRGNAIKTVRKVPRSWSTFSLKTPYRVDAAYQVFSGGLAV